MSTYDLARRLDELGWPILQTGLARIEAGRRRVDVDDLMALAVALDVSPNRLLLPAEVTVSRDDVQYGLYVVSAETRADTADMWRWATGEHPLVLRDADWKPLRAEWSGEEQARFALENAPHRYPEVLEALGRKGARDGTDA